MRPCSSVDASRLGGKATLLLLSIAAGLLASPTFANCQGEGPYPVRQCATRDGTPAWFAPPPHDAGVISATWWILGFGNRHEVDPTINYEIVDGFMDTPNPGRFIGMDSAHLTLGPATGDSDGGLDLIDAVVGTGHPLAAGGLCFSAAANWALPFIDGCADLNRTYGALGGGLDISDNHLNPYFSPATGGHGVYTDYALVDAPMGVLLTESTNRYFALAFFAAAFRNSDPDDLLDRGYDMGAIVNGDPNPAAPAGNDNIIPWQPIPVPHVVTAIDPNDGDRILSINWPMIRLVRDNSSRPNTGATQDPAADNRHVLGNAHGGSVVTGVGVLDQPELVSYEVQRKPIIGDGCDPNAPWVSAGPRVVPSPSTPWGMVLSTSVTVPEDTCIRLVTHMGRVPSVAFRTTPTLANRNQNRFDAQAGNLGDIGYSVTHAQGERQIGGPLFGNRTILRRAMFERQKLVLEFESVGEFGLESFNVMGKNRDGIAHTLAEVECNQCSTGLGSTYRVEVPRKAARGLAVVYVMVRPTGELSNELMITRSSGRDVQSR